MVTWWYLISRWVGSAYQMRVGEEKMSPPRIELGTVCVLDTCDNRYTMVTWWSLISCWVGSAYLMRVGEEKMSPPRIELGTLCVLDTCDNHYTMVTWWYLISCWVGSAYLMRVGEEKMSPPRIELWTLCVLDTFDNCYTMVAWGLDGIWLVAEWSLHVKWELVKIVNTQGWTGNLVMVTLHCIIMILWLWLIQIMSSPYGCVM